MKHEQTPEQSNETPGSAHSKRLSGRKAASERRKHYDFPIKSRAIRLKCLDCMAGSESYVKNCNLTDCALWPYRMGRSPREADLQVAQIDNLGNVTGYKHYSETD